MDAPMHPGEEPVESVEQVGSLERREFLTRAAAAGAIAWAAPVILSRPAFAVDAGSPGCATVSVDCAAAAVCPEPPGGPGNNDDIFPSFVISVTCNCAPPFTWCLTYTSDDDEIRLFTVLAGGCPGTQLDESVSYCGTSPLALIVAQGSGVEPNDYSITVTVQGTCGTETFCQTVTISGDGSEDPPTCAVTTPTPCAATGCDGCTTA